MKRLLNRLWHVSISLIEKNVINEIIKLLEKVACLQNTANLTFFGLSVPNNQRQRRNVNFLIHSGDW